MHDRVSRVRCRAAATSQRRGRERIPSRPYAVYVPYFVLFGSLPTTLLDRMLNVHVFAASSRYGVWPAYVAGSVCMFCGSSTRRAGRAGRVGCAPRRGFAGW